MWDGVGITRSHLKMSTEMHWTPMFHMRSCHPGKNESRTNPSVAEKGSEWNYIMDIIKSPGLSVWPEKGKMLRSSEQVIKLFSLSLDVGNSKCVVA